MESQSHSETALTLVLTTVALVGGIALAAYIYTRSTPQIAPIPVTPQVSPSTGPHIASTAAKTVATPPNQSAASPTPVLTTKEG